MTPREFEHEVARILHDTGYRDVRVLGKAGDLGADLTATDPQKIVVIVQCKRYAPGTRVGSPDVQMFIGAVARGLHGASRGVFVTTTEFTEPARQMALAHNVELLSGSDLGRLLEEIDRRAKGLGGEPLQLRRAG
ncbi:MAG: restriction endonuclease [Solirubrobacteraceae bacterium]